MGEVSGGGVRSGSGGGAGDLALLESFRAKLAVSAGLEADPESVLAFAEGGGGNGIGSLAFGPAPASDDPVLPAVGGRGGGPEEAGF